MIRWLCLSVLAVAVALGCDSGSPEAARWLEQQRAASTRADEALAEGNPERARTLLEQSLKQAPPPSLHENDARIVRQDIYYRLATMDLADKNPKGALAWADRGLALGRADDVFTANLLIARGRSHEALGDARAAGHDYYEALKITDRLLQDALSGDGGQP